MKYKLFSFKVGIIVSVLIFNFSLITISQAAPNSEIVFQPSSGLNNGTDEGTVSGGKDNYVSFTRYGDTDVDLGSGLNFGTRSELIFYYYASYNGYPILKFDVSTLPSDIVSAKLYLYSTANCGGGSCPAMSWTVNSITSSWDEMSATWNNRPTLGGSYGTLNIPASPSALNESGHDQWVSVDITDLYNGWKNGTITNHGIGFTRLGSTWDGGVWLNTIASSDYGTASLRPKLVTESVSPQTTPLIPGDMFIADPSAPSDQGGIYHFDFLGNQKAVYSGPDLEEPMGVAIDGDGNLIVGDPQAFSLGGAVFKINPTNGVQTVVSQGQYFVDPRGVAVAANGDIFVADSDAFNYYGGVIKVNPITGVQTPVYVSTDQNAGPYYLTVAPNGDVLVADVSGFGQLGGIIRVNPATGAWTVVSSGGNFVDPVGVVVAPNGDIFVSDNIGKVIKVNPTTGAQTVIASGGPFVCPTGIAFDNSGNLLVDDPCNEPGAVIKLNPTTGVATVLASFGSSPHGIAVVPRVVGACVVPLSGIVSEWSGEGNANDAVGVNNGTLQGGATFASGQVGQAFSFDGVDDKVLIGNPVNLRFQDFTIDAWIKLNTLSIDGFAERIAGYGIGGYGFFLSGPSVVNTNGATAVRQLSLDKPGFDMVAAPLSVNDTGWHHVAVTKSGGTVTFYLDGIAAGAQRGVTPVISYNPGFVFNSNFTLGNFDTQIQPFPGLLDEVEIYNRALTSSEIEQRYQNGISCGTVPADTIAPTITVPAPITVEAVSPEGVIVNYDASATDNVGVISFSCSPASGSTFPIGQNTVNCSASDAAGNIANASFTVTVSYIPPADTESPTIIAPQDVVVPATSSAGASGVVLGIPVVSDNIDPNPTVTNNAPAIFPIGITVVIWMAQDQAGNSAQATQQVQVLPLPPGYTETGAGVSVALDSNVNVTFSNVLTGGITTVTTSSAGPALPTQFKLGNPAIYYDISTTAIYTPPVEVCFSYAGVNYQNENNLKLRHFDGTSWVDITKSGYPDKVNKIICGVANSLSPFVITEPVETPPEDIVVKIDIKPGSFPNPINPKSSGKIPVAILSSVNFNALTQIDLSSLTFGHVGDEKSLSLCNSNGEDVNNDGRKDLICHFSTKVSNFQAQDTAGVLNGKTKSGALFQAKDSVRIVP